jgi:hypothetical protein
MDSYDQRQREAQAARIAKEAVTRKNQVYKNPVAERVYQNSIVEKNYNPKRDGINIEKEFQKDWAYKSKAHGKDALVEKTDQDIAAKLAMCGHPPADIEKVIEKHSPHFAKLEKERGREDAKKHAQQAAAYPQALYNKEKEYNHSSVLIPNDYKPFSEKVDERANERAALGRDRHSIEEIGESAKLEVTAKRQQEQRQQEMKQQAHQVTRNIMR